MTPGAQTPGTTVGTLGEVLKPIRHDEMIRAAPHRSNRQRTLRIPKETFGKLNRMTIGDLGQALGMALRLPGPKYGATRKNAVGEYPEHKNGTSSAELCGSVGRVITVPFPFGLAFCVFPDVEVGIDVPEFVGIRLFVTGPRCCWSIAFSVIWAICISMYMVLGSMGFAIFTRGEGECASRTRNKLRTERIVVTEGRCTHKHEKRLLTRPSDCKVSSRSVQENCL